MSPNWDGEVVGAGCVCFLDLGQSVERGIFAKCVGDLGGGRLAWNRVHSADAIAPTCPHRVGGGEIRSGLAPIKRSGGPFEVSNADFARNAPGINA